VNDLDTIARKAGAAARTEAAARAARHLAFQPEVTRPAGTSRKGLALATAVVALVVAVGLVVGEFAGDGGIVIEPVAPNTGEDAPTDTETAGIDDPPAVAGSAGGFVATGFMPMGCSWCEATLLDDGRVLVVGGYGLGQVGGPRAALYDPTTGTFTSTGPPAADHSQGASAQLADGRVLFVSALGFAHREDRVRDGAPPAAELYDPATGEFTAVAGLTEDVREALSRPPAAEAWMRPVALTGGQMLLVGPAAAATFDPDTGELGPIAAMAEVRPAGATATLLADGRVLVAGGAPTAEVYDPVTASFEPVGDTVTALGYATATGLGDGRVLLVGGELAEAAMIFDPATGSFTPTGSMATARSMHAAALLPDGRVLVVGGFGSSGDRTVARTAELYDPDTGQFTPAPAPTRDRRAATAVTLANGDVLVLGNYPGNGGLWPDTDSPTAEIFTLSGFEPPAGCCPDAPTALSFEDTTEPSNWAALAGRSLHATVTIPPGGIEDATAASFHWTADTASDGVGEGGDHPLPTDCHDGCHLTIPISLPPETADAEDLTVTTRLTITYTATPPASAERITIQIDAD
jgi:hypothetical protein